MLESLSIENVVLIERLHLVFKSGLTVLTGETGAGKSILLDALYLALGERADTSLIRLGEEEATVTACFGVSPALEDKLASLGFSFKEPLLILRRHVLRNGPSRAFMNDKPVTASTLRMVAGELLTIHGQFDSLLEPRTHRHLLDTYGQQYQALQDLAHHHNLWQQAEKDLATLQSHHTHKAQRVAFLTMALEDLTHLAYEPAEEVTLQQNRTTASHFTKLRELARHVHESLYGHRGAETYLSEALKACDKIHHISPGLFKPLSTFLEHTHIELQEHVTILEDFCQSSDTYDLEAIDQRLYDLKAMARKYGVEVEELASLYHTFQVDKDALSDSATHIETLEKQRFLSRDLFLKKAQEMGELRRQAAKTLENLLTEELTALKLKGAEVTFDFSTLLEAQWGPEGTERITLMVKMNEGSAWGPLSKIASGGERSRLMLALKKVLNCQTQDFTQIFDEIDTGMSGAAAAAVGSALKELSRHQQVLSISHAPQVAAKADHHWQVQKQENKGQTRTTIKVLEKEERVEEVARLISGDTITAEARAAASALLDRL